MGTAVDSTDVLLFGTMGNIGPEVKGLLEARGLVVAAVPFPQNVFRNEPGYRRGLTRAIACHKPTTVFPIGHPLAMSRYKSLVESGVPLQDILKCRRVAPEWEEAVYNTKIVVESEETIRLLDSKVRFHAMAKELGIAVPAVFDTPEDIPDGRQVVFKRDISFGGHGVHLPRSGEALQNLIAHQSPGEPYLIEEYIDGTDFCLDAVRWSGGMAAGGYACTSSRGLGPAQERKVLPDGDKTLEEMTLCAKIILDHLDYHGVCGFDFRKDTSGNILLLESNPRFTGGVASQAAAGFDIPWALYRITPLPPC